MSKGLFPKAASSSPLAGSGSDLPPVSFFKKHISISASPHTFPGIYCCNWVPAAHVSGVVTGKGMSRQTQIMKFPAQSTEYPCGLNGGRKQFMAAATWLIFIAQSLDASMKPQAVYSLRLLRKRRNCACHQKQRGFIWAFYDSS